ncbi:MAG TPA: sigma-70 family RNA polymerase sigma factor, partial [Gemmataceae bacterium]|nr:sigma-70 family RNA polymerase sigma factor [Gemmataceae bacterium]
MSQTIQALVHYLRGAGDPAGSLTDADLLGRYTARRDAAAFAALVARHGPMVLGVCRRLLSDPQDAEDAFQATFLVLVRKAATLRPTYPVGAWLHGVARRVAARAHSDRAGRRAHERRAAPMTADTSPALLWNDLRPIL